MDDRRLYAILAGGAALVVAIALIDVLAGGDDPAPAPTSRPATSTTATGAPTTTTTSPERALQDRVVQGDLRNALVAMKVIYADTARYSDDPTTVATVEPSLQYATGIATVSGAVGVVYLETSPDGQVACTSARSPSGELFLVKDVRAGEAPGTWYARGSVLPTACDGTALASSW